MTMAVVEVEVAAKVWLVVEEPRSRHILQQHRCPKAANGICSRQALALQKYMRPPHTPRRPHNPSQVDRTRYPHTGHIH